MFLQVGNAVWNLLAQSDLMTKAILLLLLVTSIISWTIIFYKVIVSKVKKRQLKTLVSRVACASSLQDYAAILKEDSKNYGWHLINQQLVYGTLLISKKAKRTITARDYQVFENQMSNLFDEYSEVEYSYIPFLAMVSSSAPFVGLLGTVWGLTHAFISISERQMADIVTIAPGIAEAFLTTLAGLMVAIPALVMYHYCKNQAHHIMSLLERIAHRVMITIDESPVSTDTKDVA